MNGSLTSPAVIPGYTREVKTAISMPDHTYEAVTRRAAELGISRSRFLVLAAEQKLAEEAADDLTARIDAAIAGAGQDEEAVDFAHTASRGTLARSRW